MQINNVSLNNPNQNFGIKVNILENDRLINLADSYLLRTVSREAIDTFETKAATVLPEKSVVLRYSTRASQPREVFDVDFYSGGKKSAEFIYCEANLVLNLLKKALNPYTRLHSELFYNGAQSPETLMKTKHFKETINRPFSFTRK